MINLAQAKGLRTTAEGIETPDQNAVLRRLGCDEVQGYLHSKPVPATAITAMLARGGRTEPAGLVRSR